MPKRNLLLSILSGALLAAALPKPGIWTLAWFGLVPLFMAMRGEKPLRTALCGLVTGSIFFGIVLFWISIFGYLPWIAVTLFQTLYIATFAVAGSRLMPNRVGWLGYALVPAAWTAMQWVRSLGAYGFTWGSLAHSQADIAPAIQIASLTGPWGIDFLICLFSISLTEIITSAAGIRSKVKPALIAAFAAAFLWIPGWIMLARCPQYKPTVKIAIIQASLSNDASLVADYTVNALMVHRKMSLEAAKGKPDFIIWPETTIPVVITNTSMSAFISELAIQTHANYVVGAYDAASDPTILESYNSAFFYDKNGKSLGAYHKVHLVPFGEFNPLRKKLPFLKNYGIRDLDVLPGKSYELIKTDIGLVGTSICFESLFPQISRLEVAHGARTLLIITNDAWFEHTQAARHHMMAAKLRAVENRRYIVRAAASGISTIIDPYGRTSSELDIFKRGIVTGKISPLTAKTPYTRLGDRFAYLCAAITCLGLLLPEKKQALSF